ncbi:hypothetical protein ACQEVB_39700 [Pseudonocardia sp. CA-107938]|uniref:hypothetical protein n=1 Tax=Pseudonocardia sp. CA-107938 TaxID=3240021 RepID=UPI003D8B7274
MRVAVALADPDDVGFTQTLAEAHEILQRYRAASSHARLVIAAADARRLGHHHALPVEFLRYMAATLWRSDECSVRRPLPAGWFDQALEEVHPVRRALMAGYA